MFRHMCMIALVILPGCLSQGVVSAAPEPTIGIITAFAPEFLAVVEQMGFGAENVTTSANRLYTVGEFSGKNVVVSICGVGATNAAMTTQNLLDTFPSVERMIFSGIAGGINPDNHIGDVVVPTQWANIHHQKFVRQIKDMGQYVQGFADFGVDFPSKFYEHPGVGVVSFKQPNDPDFCSAPEARAETIADLKKKGAVVTDGFAIPMHIETLRDPLDVFKPEVPADFWFYPDEDFLRIAKQVMATGVELQSAGIDADGKPLPKPAFKVVGPSVSSSTFVDNAVHRNNLFEVFQAETADMESASFMHVCASNSKPCGVIRSVSDMAGGEAELNVINEFIDLAAGNGVRVLSKIVLRM